MATMNYSFVTQSLQTVAAMLSSTAGIELVVDPKANTFSTDKKVLRMPTLEVIAEEYPNGVDLEAYVIGAVIHEAGHCLFTDFELRQAFKRMFSNSDQGGFALKLGQVVEDVVIERAQMNSLPGAEPALIALWGLLYKSYGSHDLMQGDLLTRAFRHVFHYARNSVLRQPWTQELAERSDDALRDVMEQSQYEAFKSDLAALYYVQTTEDGFKASLVLLKHLGIEPSLPTGEEAESKPRTTEMPDLKVRPCQQTACEDSGADVNDEPAQEGASQMAQPNDGSDEAGDSQGSSKDQHDGIQGKSSPEIGTMDGAKEEGDNPGTSGVGGVQSEPQQPEQDEDTEPDVGVKIATESDDRDAEEGAGVVAAAGYGLAVAQLQREVTCGMELRHRVLMGSMFASAKLSSLLKAQTASRTEFTKRGVIVPSRLWKLQAGNLKVFRRTTEGIELSTAIKILLDRSTSMEDDMDTALEAAVFLPLAFDQVDGIQTSLDIFPGFRQYSETVKPFHKRTTVCLDDIARVTASGGTPMMQAIQKSGADLLSVTADRHLLVVVTDGEPFDKNSTRRTVNALEREGVEVIGIGIGSETRASMKVIFKDHCVIKNTGELTDELYHVMLQKLAAQPVAA